jgi:hypothetical protein
MPNRKICIECTPGCCMTDLCEYSKEMSNMVDFHEDTTTTQTKKTYPKKKPNKEQNDFYDELLMEQQEQM